MIVLLKKLKSLHPTMQCTGMQYPPSVAPPPPNKNLHLRAIVGHIEPKEYMVAQ